MRAAMYYKNSDIRLEEIPKPKIGPGEILVQIHASGLCGSDVMEWYRIHKAPLVLGHEIAGKVVSVGDGVDNFFPGDRVVATHHVPCCSCHFCLSGHETVCETLLSKTSFDPGGFCEYVRLSPINVRFGTWNLPDHVDYDVATFVEPLACVLRGQKRAQMKPGSRVLVIGAGISGLLHVHLASTLGAGMIAATDLNDYRRKMALEFGANQIFDGRDDVPSLFRKANNGMGADLVIVCAGAEQAFLQAMNVVERGGTILVFAPTMEGVSLPLSINNLFWRRDVTITTTYAGGPVDCVEALELIANGRLRVGEMITHRFPLAETVEGSKLVAAGAESMKVIIRPQQ